MMKSNKSSSPLFISLLTALTASLCCITPFLALLAGSTGIVAVFSWVEPLRPFLIALTIGILVFAWFRKLNLQKETNCNCSTDTGTKFIQSKAFLGIVTAFTMLLLAFPYYSDFLNRSTKKEEFIVAEKNVEKKVITVEGMTCSGCEGHVESEVNKLPGIVLVIASYENSNTTVEYDKSLVEEQEIYNAINKTGYKAVLDPKKN